VLLVNDAPHGPDSARLKLYDRLGNLRLELETAMVANRAGSICQGL
jgi:hypothetical protein